MRTAKALPSVLAVCLLAVGVYAFANGADSSESSANDTPAFSEEALDSLFRGNSINGVWGKDAIPYRQHFFENGRTLYMESNGHPSWGTWRINTRGWYCSIWPPSSSEACYQVLQGDGDGAIVWVTSSGGRYPATVGPGNIFER